MARILILLAHPMLEKSRVQQALLSSARSLPAVTVQDLYQEYPDFDVDVRREQELLLQHDLIVLQHPFYWYGCPALMKQWIDLVLEHGWAYGRQGKALQGKQMLNAISTGGSREAYQHGGYNRRTIREFLFPFEQTALLCKMKYLPPFVVHGTHRATEDDISSSAAVYENVLSALANGQFDEATIGSVEYLNELGLRPLTARG